MRYRSKEGKTWNALLAAGVAVLLISVIDGNESSTLATTCKLHDPNNGPCLMQQWQNIFINSNKGTPGAEGLSAAIDPYKPKNVRVSIDIPILTLRMNLKKIVITGLAQAHVSDVSITNEELFNITMTLPTVHIKGNYAMEGRILLLNLNGKGPLEIDIADVVLSISLKLKTVVRDGERLFEPLALKTHVKHVGNMHLNFSNLFGDNQPLNDSANEVFNQNWSEIIELARPVIKEAMDASLLEQAKNFLSNVPARFIFSDLS